MRASSSVLAGVLALAWLPSCATSGRLEEEMSRLRRDVRDMKKDLDETRVALERLEGRVTLLSLGRDGVAPAPQTPVAKSAVQPPKRRARTRGRAEARERAPERVLPVVRLAGNADRAAPEEGDDDLGALDDGSPPIMIKLRGQSDHGSAGEGDRLTVDREVLKRPDPVLDVKRSRPAEAVDKSADEIRGEYKNALTILREQKDPEKAEALLESFLKRYPQSRLADNAHYWIGECRFERGLFREAIDQFEELLRQFPRSGKRPDALSRIGESWLRLGNTDRARKALRSVIDLYPTSEAATRAKARLGSIAAEGGK